MHLYWAQSVPELPLHVYEQCLNVEEGRMFCTELTRIACVWHQWCIIKSGRREWHSCCEIAFCTWTRARLLQLWELMQSQHEIFTSIPWEKKYLLFDFTFLAAVRLHGLAHPSCDKVGCHWPVQLHTSSTTGLMFAQPLEKHWLDRSIRFPHTKWQQLTFYSVCII